MIGGGVPKNFTQDIVVAAEVLGHDAPMHKYAIQVTVADVRDGALSSSTLKEASSWGKVDTVYEQMVFSEATLAVPLIVGYAYHKGGWRGADGEEVESVAGTAGGCSGLRNSEITDIFRTDLRHHLHEETARTSATGFGVRVAA